MKFILNIVYCIIFCNIAGSQGDPATSQWGVRSDYNGLKLSQTDPHSDPFLYGLAYNNVDYFKPAQEPIQRKNKVSNNAGRRSDRNNGHRKQRRQKNNEVKYSKVKLPTKNKNEVEESDETVQTSIYRTYGKGTAIIPKHGADVYVPRTAGLSKVYKGSATTKLRNRQQETIQHEGKVYNRRSRRDCIGCPDNQAVVARKGEPYIVLPEPCPSLKWQTIFGPSPGMKLREGRHHLIGRLGHRKKICKFQYQVIVMHCRPLSSQRVNITCSADDAWGSKCSMDCYDDQELVGPTETECNDDLTWTNPLPKCKKQSECFIPSSLTQGTLKCTTVELISEDMEFLPDGTTCKYDCEGNNKHTIQCVHGNWNETEKCPEEGSQDNIEETDDTRLRNDVDEYVNDESTDDPCEPNPCLNGGTCLLDQSSTALCVCPPGTKGDKCELKKCDSNICGEKGQCFVKDFVETCFCQPGYTGAFCQTSQHRRRHLRSRGRHHQDQ